MLAVKTDEPLDRQDYSSMATTLRAQLGEIVGVLTARFDTASLALGDAVTTIDQIVNALQEIASVFDTGEAAAAVSNLMEAADNLQTVPAQAGVRAQAVAEIRSSSISLRSCAGDILRCIQVLDVYGMNVKINACGAAEFMDFADRMREKLFAASGEVRSLDKTLERLESSLREMIRNDELLVEECAKVVPQVPDRLMQDAQALRQHQAGLVRLAQATNDVAKATRTELGLAISAIQIGDRVRQRLEHVMFGCQLAENVSAGGDDDMLRVDELQRHLLPLLGALTRAAAAEFADDAEALVVSLHRLKETSAHLTALQGPGCDEEGHGFLDLLKCGIAEANGIIDQLSQAERQGAATREQILATVNDVAAQMAAITELRLEVRNMAINIGLRCRNVGETGKPIAVVANEIRSYSDRLDLIVSSISRAETALIESSSRMGGQGAKGTTSLGQLSDFVDVIGECGRRTTSSLAFVDANAGNVQSALNRAITDLEPLIGDTGNLANTISIFDACDLDLAPAEADPNAKLSEIYGSLFAAYTMNAERDLHNRILGELGLDTLRTEVDSPCDVDEDDFDDGLF
ncbi:hypothetical protein [Porphyrobacter sp. ULC335]|uniref:hypothetical protein n=1 Tax=Porphyrobacter sp. ULC335 TaxID=2854260 RepID=UPI00221ECF84|nr:hypothetical protein [Porphyrobacter sp. ULC335]UYV16020.1 hypothetical protein KVF90_01325 [Porphyrobacter sp. ULC335]